MEKVTTRRLHARTRNDARHRLGWLAAVLVLGVLTTAGAFEGPGISADLPGAIFEHHFMFLDKETGTKIFVLSGHMQGVPPDASVEDVMESVWNKLSPNAIIREFKGPIEEESGWDTRVCMALSPNMMAAAKIWLLNKGELRAVLMMRPGPIPREYFDGVIRSVKVWPREET